MLFACVLNRTTSRKKILSHEIAADWNEVRRSRACTFGVFFLLPSTSHNNQTRCKCVRLNVCLFLLFSSNIFRVCSVFFVWFVLFRFVFCTVFGDCCLSIFSRAELFGSFPCAGHFLFAFDKFVLFVSALFVVFDAFFGMFFLYFSEVSTSWHAHE